MHEYYASKTSQQNFRYVDTPLVEAIRNGYLIEIQEPTVIANPGVLVGLNSLMVDATVCSSPTERRYSGIRIW